MLSDLLTFSVAVTCTLSLAITTCYVTVFIIRLCSQSVERGGLLGISLICIICTVLFILGDMLHFWLSYIHHYGILYDPPPIFMLNLVSSALYFVSTTLIYTILIWKLHFVFQDTIYRINACFLCLVATMITTSFLLMLAYLFTISFSYNTSAANSKFTDIFESVTFRKLDDLFRVLLDFALNVSCGSIFVYKLRESLLMLHEFDVNGINDSLLRITFDENDERIIDLVTRQTVLGIWVTLFNQLYNLTTFVISFYWEQHEKLHSLYLALIFISRNVEGVCNVVILFYFFRMNVANYYQCCGYCHRCCFGVCARHSRYTLKRRRTKQLQLRNSIQLTELHTNVNYVQLTDQD